MTERHNKHRSEWTPEEHDAHQQDLRRQREQWEQQKKLEAERKEREEKQARLEAYLRRRVEAWTDHTGSLPPADVVSGWQQQYLDERAAEEDREREAKLAAAIEENYPY